MTRGSTTECLSFLSYYTQAKKLYAAPFQRREGDGVRVRRRGFVSDYLRSQFTSTTTVYNLEEGTGKASIFTPIDCLKNKSPHEP